MAIAVGILIEMLVRMMVTDKTVAALNLFAPERVSTASLCSPPPTVPLCLAGRLGIFVMGVSHSGE